MGIEQGVKRAARFALPAFIAGAGFFGCGRDDGNTNVTAAVVPTTEVPPATQEISPTAEATPTIQPILEPTPTKIPVPTETATPKPPEATATPIPEKLVNFLPQYSVFYGEMTQENGTGKGSVVIANIPGYPDQLYAFFMANRSGGGFLYPINKTGGNSLEAGGKVEITLEDAQTLSGRLAKFSDASPTAWGFKIPRYGTGRAAIIEAEKKLWAIEIANAPAEWPRVPEATILGAGFRKIELP